MITDVTLFRQSSHDEAIAQFCVSTLPQMPFALSLKRSVAAGKASVLFRLSAVANGTVLLHEHMVPGYARDCRILLQQTLTSVTDAFVTDVLMPLCEGIKHVAGISISREVLCADQFMEPPAFRVDPDACKEQTELNRLCFRDATA